MEYLKVKIKTKYNVEDIVSNVIFENGIVGVEIEDKSMPTNEDLKKMYVDIPLYVNNDEVAYVIFYVKILFGEDAIKKIEKDNVDISYKESDDNVFTDIEFLEISSKIEMKLNEINEYIDLGELKIEYIQIKNLDYLNEWKKYFKVIKVDDIIIKPIWDEKKYDGVNVNIDPGSAFGTGQHATTKLCIKNLRDYIAETKNKKLSMLDIGCGSGILGIVAKKIGVLNVTNVDVDDTVDNNIKRNMEINEIKQDENFKIFYGNLIDEIDFNKKIFEKKYDIIVCNILAPIVIAMIEKANICNYINDDGILILSGIIKEKKDIVISSIKRFTDLHIVKEDIDGDWVCILAKRVKK